MQTLGMTAEKIAPGPQGFAQLPHHFGFGLHIKVDQNVAQKYEIELPGDAGFETLAGFLLFRLGYIPGPGESVTYGSRTFIVEEMDRNRISRVKIITARPADAEA